MHLGHYFMKGPDRGKGLEVRPRSRDLAPMPTFALTPSLIIHSNTTFVSSVRPLTTPALFQAALASISRSSSIFIPAHIIRLIYSSSSSRRVRPLAIARSTKLAKSSVSLFLPLLLPVRVIDRK